jgi:uncharacterized protein YuzE
MKLEYYADTDTLYIELRDGPSDETIDAGLDTLIDLDAEGAPIGITIEHASKRFDLGTIKMENFPLTMPRKAA